MWYARKGGRILDMIIAPRFTFAACYQAAALRLTTGDTAVAFGSTHNAYVCEGGAWRVVALDGLRASDLPPAWELTQCVSTTEIAGRVLGR